MSFEGYYQLICKNGHQFSVDCFFAEPEEAKCPVCNEKTAWWNLVDITNGSFDENKNRIDGYMELEIDKPEIWCNSCECKTPHKISIATYKIPTEGGHVIP
jgi:hypothetical protein